MIQRIVQSFLLTVVVALSSITLSALSTQTALANNAAYTFETEAQERQFRQLINEIRCPKCQNQTIAESDAPLALDLRERVYQMTVDGYSRAEILDFMRTRYGDFVHYKPPLRASTVILWAGPGLALLIGVATIIGITRRQRRAEGLSAEEQARLDTLLDDEPSAADSSHSDEAESAKTNTKERGE